MLNGFGLGWRGIRPVPVHRGLQPMLGLVSGGDYTGAVVVAGNHE